MAEDTENKNIELNLDFEKIVPWNGQQDTGRDVRLKLDRNWKKVADAFNTVLNYISTAGLDNKFLRKDQPDTAQEIITFLKGLLVGQNGHGISVLEDGSTQAVVDRLYVNVKAFFDALEVKKKTYVGGEQILSPAGMKCIRVETLQNVYRCYMKAEEDGIQIEHEFVEGHLAICQECNIKVGVAQHQGNRFYWREVVAVGSDYIDLSMTPCANDSDIPAEGDDIVALGHRTDVVRQSAIILSSVAETAPSIIFYQGIDDFILDGKEVIALEYDRSTGHAKVRIYGSTYIGDKNGESYMSYDPKKGLEIKGTISVGTKLSDGRDLEEALKASTPEGYKEFVESVNGSLDYLQKQIDGAIDSYYFDYNPSMDNYPAKDWTEKEKEAHLGDTFTNNSTGESWRFGKDGDKYQWIYIEDTATKKALAAAISAVDVADSKRRTFIKTPTLLDAYDVGDLWVNATYGQYSNDLLKCDVAKKANEPFDINHWSKASKYTDDGKVEELRISVNDLSGELEKLGVDIESVKQQTDREYTIWFFNYEPTLSNEPASNWTTPELKAEHDQDLFYYREAGKAWRFEDGS